VYAEDNPLRRARLQRGIGLSQVIARTMLSARIVNMIDAGRLAELPGGIYARSYVRAFASAVGLDGDEAVASLEDRLPPAQDPMPTLREISRVSEPAWVLAFSDARAAVIRSVAGAAAAARRRTVASTTGWPDAARRVAAAAIDAAILLALLAAIVRTTAWTCGVGVDALLAVSSPALAAMWGILVALYFVVLGGVGGRTPGAWITQLRHDGRRSQRHLPAVLERALMY
jgi:hypothetical protein